MFKPWTATGRYCVWIRDFGQWAKAEGGSRRWRRLGCVDSLDELRRRHSSRIVVSERPPIPGLYFEWTSPGLEYRFTSSETGRCVPAAQVAAEAAAPEPESFNAKPTRAISLED